MEKGTSRTDEVGVFSDHANRIEYLERRKRLSLQARRLKVTQVKYANIGLLARDKEQLTGQGLMIPISALSNTDMPTDLASAKINGGPKISIRRAGSQA